MKDVNQHSWLLALGQGTLVLGTPSKDVLTSLTSRAAGAGISDGITIAIIWPTVRSTNR